MERLKKYPIKCYKLSNKIDDKIYIPEKYSSTIKLSLDGRKLIIMNKKLSFNSKYKRETHKSNHLQINLNDNYVRKLKNKKLLESTIVKMNKSKKGKIGTLKGFL